MANSEVVKFVEDFKSAIDGVGFPVHPYGNDYSALMSDAKRTVIDRVDDAADYADSVEDVISEVEDILDDRAVIADEIAMDSAFVYTADLLEFFANNVSECEDAYNEYYVMGDHESIVDTIEVAVTLVMENEASEAVVEYLDDILGCFNELVSDDYS